MPVERDIFVFVVWTHFGNSDCSFANKDCTRVVGVLDCGVMKVPSVTLSCLTSLLAITSPAWADSFGIASAYNVLALTGDVTAGSDIGGRVAAAGTILSAGTVAANPIANDIYGSLYGNPFDFVSPGGYSGPSVNINGTSGAYAPGASTSSFNFNDGGTLVTTGSSGINFSSLASSINTESLALGALASTGTAATGGNPNLLVLTGLSPTLNIFTLTAAQLSSYVDLDIEAPTGSTIIVNVTGGTGSSIQVPTLSYNGVQISGDSATDDKILFNFYQDTTTVNFDGQFSASVLAPLAEVTGNSQLDGTIISGSFDDNGEIHNVAFDGNIPPTSTSLTPEPSSLLLLATGAAGILGAVRRRLR